MQYPHSAHDDIGIGPLAMHHSTNCRGASAKSSLCKRKLRCAPFAAARNLHSDFRLRLRLTLALTRFLLHLVLAFSLHLPSFASLYGIYSLSYLHLTSNSLCFRLSYICLALFFLFMSPSSSITFHLALLSFSPSPLSLPLRLAPPSPSHSTPPPPLNLSLFPLSPFPLHPSLSPQCRRLK